MGDEIEMGGGFRPTRYLGNALLYQIDHEMEKVL